MKRSVACFIIPWQANIFKLLEWREAFCVVPVVQVKVISFFLLEASYSFIGPQRIVCSALWSHLSQS